jgi:cytochrome c-type biogenesis protein CcmH/NrfF
MRDEGRGKREEMGFPGVRAGVRFAGRALALLLLVLAVPVAAAARDQAERRPGEPLRVSPAAEAVARTAMFRLRSPATPSHTLDMCPHPAAEALRDTLRMAAEVGQTADQISEGVIARYGEHMRLLPKRRGFGVWAWVLPPAVLLFGAGVVVSRVRTLRAAADYAEPDAPMSDEDRASLAEALAELERIEAEESA